MFAQQQDQVIVASAGQVPLWAYLGLALAMFVIGGIGVVSRRNPVVVFMCVELMLNSVNLTFLAFAKHMPMFAPAGTAFKSAVMGEMMVIFVMAVAAAEVAVGLGIIMAIFRLRNEVDVDDMSMLKEPGAY